MDSRERSAKKRKREVKKPKQDTGAVEHKSPFAPFRTTEGAEKSQKKRRSVDGPKSSKPNSKDRKKTLNRELIESGEDDALDKSDAETTDDVISSSAKVFSDLDIAPEIQRTIVSMGFSDLKEIQRNSIPLILARKDVSLFFFIRPIHLYIINSNLSTYRS